MTERHVDGKIVPPPLLERALTAALAAVDDVKPAFTDPALQAEAILYAEPMQAWMHGELARYEALTARADSMAEAEALPHEGMLREPEDLVPVECRVIVPLDSPHAAAHALGRVPINAKVEWEAGTTLFGLMQTGTLVATWTEER